MTLSVPAPVFPYYRSPASIRGEVFTQRLRGLDPQEVDEYLNLLADQVETCERERADLFDEIDRLRQDVARLQARESATDQVEPRAAELLGQAQLVADQLVEEAVLRAQELIAAAHRQQREIIEAAHMAADAAAREAAQLSAQNFSSYVGAPAPEVEYARRFTQVLQVQLRSVVDALCDQVDQLGQMSRLCQTPLPAYAGDDLFAVTGREVQMDAIPASPAVPRLQPTLRVAQEWAR